MNIKYLLFSIAMFLSLAHLWSQDETLEFSPSFRYCPDRDYDLAWENDLVAFRLYGFQPNENDGLSGIDAWHKSVSYPILDKWYNLNKEGKSYHQDYGEGCDQYHVGKTRGVGGIGLWINDKIVRSGLYEDWEVISLTQTKLSFRLQYSWTISGEQIIENRVITIENGSQLYSAESSFTKNGKAIIDLEIAIGLSTQNGIAKVHLNENEGWMTAWHELNNSAGMMGTGTIVETNQLIKMLEQKSEQKDASHIIAVMKTNSNGTINWKAGFAWEKAGVITTQTQWEAYISNY
ncbi:DUF4861 family protein [uncultured Algibacter sp.]|uniref:DUF4861 family protein n=1 Tax=uncultured Algibacter sp. TaxID=298659 RepID=UPI00260AF4E3|nr:DUF4861 family protein [uncultured Algibacter sp.]